MKYETELMRSILTNPKAQEMVDYISPIYGNSYVALWILQAAGTIMGEVYNVAEQLKYETNPATSSLLLDYFERQYAIPMDTSLTKEQRRERIIGKIQFRGPCNPVRLGNSISGALGGVPVDIIENTAKNTFLVQIWDVVPSLKPAISVLESRKPAHLIYKIKVTSQATAQTKIKIATAMTHVQRFKVDVASYYETQTVAETKIKIATAVTHAQSFKMEVR